MTEEQNKGLAELAEKALEQWACAIESLQHAPESYDCDSAWRQHHEMRREIAALRDREPATEAVLEMAIAACRKWLKSREAQYYNWAMNGSDGSTEGNERDAVKHCIQAIRVLKGKGASQDEDAKR